MILWSKGLPAIQIAKSLGCKVIATASSASKLQVCIDQGGADFAVNYSDPSWKDDVMKITKGKGVDVVFDPVGLLIPSLKVAGWKCRLIVVGFVGGTIEKVRFRASRVEQSRTLICICWCR